MITQPDNTKINAPVLYFLEGHYIFQYKEKGKKISKFVTANDLVAAFSKVEVDSGWLSPGIVRTGLNANGAWFVYSAPVQKVSIILDREDSFDIPIPRTLLIGTGKKMYLFALAVDHFSRDTLVYRAPFPNVYEDGRICWGQNAAPPVAVEKARQAWELFFKAPFNGDLVNGKCASSENDVRQLLRGLAEKNKFPLKELVRYRRNATVQAVVNEIIGA